MWKRGFVLSKVDAKLNVIKVVDLVPFLQLRCCSEETRVIFIKIIKCKDILYLNKVY